MTEAALTAAWSVGRLTTALLAVLVALTLAGGSAAADFSGFNPTIKCGPMTGAPAWAIGVLHDDGTIELRNTPTDYCAAIDRAARRNLRNSDQVKLAAQAVFTLAHELSHVLGTRDLHVTATGEDSNEPDCVAWLLYPWVTAKLGIRAQTAARLSPYVRAWGEQSCQAWRSP